MSIDLDFDPQVHKS